MGAITAVRRTWASLFILSEFSKSPIPVFSQTHQSQTRNFFLKHPSSLSARCRASYRLQAELKASTSLSQPLAGPHPLFAARVFFCITAPLASSAVLRRGLVPVSLFSVCGQSFGSASELLQRPRKGLAMKRSSPWDEPVQNPDSSSNDIPLPITSIDLTSQDILIRRAEIYQEYMKQIPIPSQRGSVIPFNSWMGLGKSIKQLYGQPLHYLTNVILKQWDQLRLNSKDEYKPLDNLIHPTKAEATIWLMEEVHRQTSSHFQIAELWKLDPMYNCSVDAIFPTLEKHCETS
ncbi:hypothetical protein HN873_050945 [Arachis hypogaea]